MKFKNLSLSFFSIVILLLLIEIILRITGSVPRKINDFTLNEPLTNIPDDVLGWSSKVGQHKFNPWSQDGKTTYLTIQEDKSRFTGTNNMNEKIVFIGGSVTLGWAVSDHETFASIIQNKTNNYKILNYGVGGYGAYQSLLLLEKIFKNKNEIKLVIYGYIPHHEVRNVAAGSWMYLLNYFSKRGFVKLPYASIDKNKNLIKNNPIQYINLPFGDKSALIAKLEKRIMKIKSYSREKKQFEISKAIIKEMVKISEKNNSKFKLLILENLTDSKLKKYSKFVSENNISMINCRAPQGEKYIVKGDGHPSYDAHQIIADCIYKKVEILNSK